MPTYLYRREDGTKFEIEQRITEDPLETCPTTGQPVKRVIAGGAGLVFKGSGFYLTDYARKNGKGSSSPSKESTSDTKPEKTEKTEKKEAKTETSTSAEKDD